jgi:hypothetical protein
VPSRQCRPSVDLGGDVAGQGPSASLQDFPERIAVALEDLVEHDAELTIERSRGSLRGYGLRGVRLTYELFPCGCPD